jgi:hypothetical protein
MPDALGINPIVERLLLQPEPTQDSVKGPMNIEVDLEHQSANIFEFLITCEIL